VAPERVIHVSSQQRVTWFQRGFDRGGVKQCNTFAARQSGRPLGVVA
jgi:predicted metalloprotease